MLERIARFCYRRRRFVVIGWVIIVLVIGGLQSTARFRTEFSLPASETKRGFDILKESFPSGGQSGFVGQLVFKADAGITDPAVTATINDFVGKVAAIDGLTVRSPLDPAAQGQVANKGSLAGKVAYATVNFPRSFQNNDYQRVTKQVEKLVPAQAGLQVELGGVPFARFDPPKSEVLGLAFAVVILLLAFGSVLAMGLPVGTALAGIATGGGLVAALSHWVKMPDFTNLLGAMIGLGVGIDYALFIVTRHREEMHRGRSTEESIVTAIDTAGRAVLFAGMTVVISLLGMFLMGLAFVRGLAIGASTTVLLTMAASLTLLPALLGLAKHRVEVTRWRGLLAVAFLALALLCVGLKAPKLAAIPGLLAVVTILASFAVPALRRELPRRRVKPLRETVWYSWSRRIQHRPWPFALLGLVILLALAVPVLSLRLGSSDTGNYSKSSSTRRAYDLMTDGFGPGFNGVLMVVSHLPAGSTAASAAPITEAIKGTSGVAFVSPVAGVNNPNVPTAAQWFVVPTTSPQDAATTQLVHRLRNTTLAPFTAQGFDPAVTGGVAADVDFADYLSRRLPIFFGGVLALSFVLLMAVFRSLLVPLKAVVMNLLSIGAAYGVVVAVFQWGWLKGLVGVGKGGPIESWVPMMMFAIVFGLSMDYEVFLLSRMKEEFDHSGDNATAVADGLATTARVITAAAAIMVFVFGSFLLESNRQIKMFGLGLGIAVLLDATVVRMILVPATMELLGKSNWWMPRWLNRLLPKIEIEGHTPHELVGTGPRDDELVGAPGN